MPGIANSRQAARKNEANSRMNEINDTRIRQINRPFILINSTYAPQINLTYAGFLTHYSVLLHTWLQVSTAESDLADK